MTPVHLYSMGDVLAQMDYVDEPDVEERVKTAPALRPAFDMIRPRNWWGVGVPAERLTAIAEEGIPLAWVPRTEVVRQLADRSDRAARVAVLLANEVAIVDDCEAAIALCRDEWLLDKPQLATAAMTAWREGHPEAAMALAVVLCDGLALQAAEPKVIGFYSEKERAGWEKTVPKGGVKRALWLARWHPTRRGRDVSQHVLTAPLHSFFAAWRPADKTEPPVALSRNVVVHLPSAGHMTRENGLIALMLLASLLRDAQDWCEEVRGSDGPEGSE